MSEADITADYPDLAAASLLKKTSLALAGDGTRRAVMKPELLAHPIETGKVPPGKALAEKEQLPARQ